MESDTEKWIETNGETDNGEKGRGRDKEIERQDREKNGQRFKRKSKERQTDGQAEI